MKILFLHKNFPAQFIHLLHELAKDAENEIYFITANNFTEVQGVKKLVYVVDNQSPCLNYSDSGYTLFFEDTVLHGQAASRVAQELKESGFVPDIIYGHSWGTTMFMKDIFPDVPLICYFEWFYNIEGGDIQFDGRMLSETGKSKVRCRNPHLLMDLCSCDAGVTPTNFQKSQFPKEFLHKIKVMHDGINTDYCEPNPQAKFVVKDKGIEFGVDDEVITYATRGMEPYRGFPQFMMAVEKLLKKRPNAHFIIAGEDKTFYGAKLDMTTYKDFMLSKLDIDLNRVHFVGPLPFDEYVNLLQVSSAHVYLTYPFVLSWSILDAMSCGACVVASKTPPVVEVIKNNHNGLLFDFYNVDQQIEKIEYVLDNQEKIPQIRKNARQTILDNYSLKKIMPMQLEFIKSFIN